MKKHNGNFKEWFRLTKDDLVPVIAEYNGFYTASPELATPTKFEKLVDFANRIDALIRVVFPVARPNLILLFLIIVTVALFQGLSLVLVNIMSKEAFVILMLSVFSSLAFACSTRRILSLSIIFMIYSLRFATFDYLYAGVDFTFNNVLLKSFVSVVFYFSTPIAAYWFTLILSDVFDFLSSGSVTSRS